ncbi:MAG TPA: flagellar biosynthesis protein FlhF [Myxococcales bacterium]|nr:flagellar biosynthesis protein FlhF [Myxococcales bacterium]
MSHATIRTFRAADARSALAAAKAALGPQAVVLQTREVPRGPFRKSEVEVMAALEDADLPVAASPWGPRATSATPVAPPSEKPAIEMTTPQQPIARLKLQRGEPLVNDTPSREQLDSLRAAVEETRQLLAGISAQGRSSQVMQLAPAAADVHAALIKRGVEPSEAARLVREALALGTPAKPLALLAAVRELLVNQLEADRAPWARRGKRAIAMVGPTGVGKTTTLAKIAARALLETKSTVGLITVDTWRIGASEQLARYGEIMGIPAFTARTPTELRSALERLEQCELVLIDTAGRSQHDLVMRQAAMVRQVPGVELHLVLSAASGQREMEAVAQKYEGIAPERMVVAKLDEAVATGGFLSAASGLKTPVSCVCDGQRVPEDIHAVSRADLVDLVLGSWNR